MKPLAVVILAALAGIASSRAAYADEPGVERDSSSRGLTGFLQDQRASGVLRADYCRASKSLDNDIGFLGATAQVKALPSFTEAVDGKLEMRVTNPAIGEGAATQSRLLEGYATVHFEKADLRVGKQIVPWGRADGINPTDNLTPRDFVVLLPFEEDQRFGISTTKSR